MWGRGIARVILPPDPSDDLQCIICINYGSDLLVKICVHNLTFLFLVALAHVTNVVGKCCLDTFDFDSISPAGLSRASWCR